jgi:hypothetical protein
MLKHSHLHFLKGRENEPNPIFSGDGFNGQVFTFVLANTFFGLLAVGQLCDVTVSGQTLFKNISIAKLNQHKLRVNFCECHSKL